LAEIGLARNSVTPASRAAITRFFSEWPVSMMIGTYGLLFAPGWRIIWVSSSPSKIGMAQSVMTMSGE
jgi:hypothetical protein